MRDLGKFALDCLPFPEVGASFYWKSVARYLSNWVYKVSLKSLLKVTALRLITGIVMRLVGAVKVGKHS